MMSVDAPVTTRIPKASYANRNGFLAGPTEPDDVSNLEEALQRHKSALYVIQNKRRLVPDFETMQAEIEKPDDLATVKDSLAMLKSEHLEDLQLLYAIHSQDYVREATDKYKSKDESPLSDDAKAKLQEIYSGGLKDALFQNECANDYEILRYTYLSRLLPLERRKRELEKEEDESRKRREQMFPQSKDDFYNKPNDVRVRAARFLVADPARQERMLSEFQWAWRQVKPLQDIFSKDEAFGAEIRSMIIADRSVKDPRKRAF